MVVILICELLLWGQNSSPGWLSAENEASTVGHNLQFLKLGTLKIQDSSCCLCTLVPYGSMSWGLRAPLNENVFFWAFCYAMLFAPGFGTLFSHEHYVADVYFT